MVCYRLTCLLCLRAGHPADHVVYDDAACYFGQSGRNAHCRIKEHVSKFSSKSQKIREESAFYKHLESTHAGKDENKSFADYFEVRILKAYRKPFTMCMEEGTYISSHKRELLNSKSEWHQAKLIRTTTRVVQGGAESLREQGSRREGGRAGAGGEAAVGGARGGQHGGRGGRQPRGQGRTRGQ